MKEMLQQINNWIESIGKRNFVLFVFVFTMVIISGLYTTFSLSTFHESTVSIDGIKTMKFVLGESDKNQTVSIAENSTKNVAVTISNREETALSYGIFYVTADDLTDVDIGYRHSTEYLPNGVIEPNKDYIVTIRIANKSNAMKMISFGLLYGLENGGDLVLEEQQHFLKQENSFPLSEARKGSYVKYSGNNGCILEQCSGNNSNSVLSDVTDDVNDSKVDIKNDYGYCGSEDTNFTSSGWRIAYVKNGYPYIISAGSPECIKDEEEKKDLFLKKLNDKAITYCNMDYSYLGVCDSQSAWNMNYEDYYSIFGNQLNNDICFQNDKDASCGYQNDLIDIGSYYWVSSVMNDGLVYYKPNLFSHVFDDLAKGLRPIIKLSDTVVVYQGSGTKEDPYLIKNKVLPDYEYKVVYYGNGATSGDVADSVFHTNVRDKLNKNQYHLKYKVKMSDIAIFDDSYCDDDNKCYDSSIADEMSKEAKFLGWSIVEDADEAMYLDEEEVMNLSISSEEVIVNLYAIWEYDAFVLPDIQNRNGYDVLGWYTEKNGGEFIGKPGDEYRGDKNVHLYARWKKK